MAYLYKWISIWLAILFLGGCSQEEPPYQPQFSSHPPAGNIRDINFGVHPLHNPQRLSELYGPIMDYLSAHIKGVSFHLEASRNYDEYNKKLYAGHFEFALPNPYQTIRALDHGYHVFGKMGDDHNFRAILLVRHDSDIKELVDLKGRKVSYPARTALAPTMLMQYYLQTHGLDVDHDIESVYVGSQESSIMNAYLGNVAAGATWPIPWLAFQKEHPDMAQELEVKWQTEPLVNNAVVARGDMPPELVHNVAELLIHLHETAAGRTMLERLPLSRFEQADDATYNVVRIFIAKYSETVHPLEQ